MEETDLGCPRYVFTHRQLGIPHQSEITNFVGGFNYTGTSLYDLDSLRDLLQDAGSSERMQFRADAQQLPASTKQSLRVDIIRGRRIVDSAAFPTWRRRTYVETGHIKSAGTWRPPRTWWTVPDRLRNPVELPTSTSLYGRITITSSDDLRSVLHEVGQLIQSGSARSRRRSVCDDRMCQNSR